MAAPNILCDTTGMTNAQWLAARMHGPSGKIPYTGGGSDVAAVFGVSPWTTPLELWMIKKGRMKPPAKSNANQLEMGHLLEPSRAVGIGFIFTHEATVSHRGVVWSFFIIPFGRR